MSRRRVAYIGGRPVSVDEGPSSAAAHDVVSMHANGGMAGLPIAPTGGAGPVERRKATPEEMAAARAREVRPEHLTAPRLGTPGPIITDAKRAQRSRQRGAQRHVEVVAALRGSSGPSPEPAPAIEEEPVVSEARADIPETIPEPEVVDLDIALEQLARAAEVARLSWERKLLATESAISADAAWEVARASLAYAWGQAGLDVSHSMPAALYDELQAAVDRMEDGGEETPAETAAIDRLEEALIDLGRATLDDASASVALDHDPAMETQSVGPAPRRNVQEPRTDGLSPRQERALALFQDGQTRAQIAKAFGTTYQTIDGLFEAIAKKGLMPIELIPLLPARFAKYTGV